MIDPLATDLPVGRHFALDLVKTAHMSGHARGDIEHRARRRGCLKFERADRGHAQLYRTSGHGFTRAGGEPAGLRDEFNQDDGRNDRVGRESDPEKTSRRSSSGRRQCARTPGTSSTSSSTRRIGGWCGSRSTDTFTRAVYNCRPTREARCHASHHRGD